MPLKPRLSLPAIALSLVLIWPSVVRSQSISDLSQQAQQAQNQKDFPKAEMLWRQALQQGPATASAYYSLGLSLHQQLKLAEAIKAYQQATKIDPQYSPAFLNLGIAWLDARNYIQAAAAFQQVIALPNQSASPGSTHTLAYYNLAILHKREGQLEQAREKAQKALAVTPGFAPALQLLQQL